MVNVSEKVKQLLQSDDAYIDFVVSFPNGELGNIQRDEIVMESVSFTESLSSQQYLQFGLTEASVIEFETVGVENIVGYEIECAYDVYSHKMVGAQLYLSGNTGEETADRDSAYDETGIFIDMGDSYDRVFNIDGGECYVYCGNTDGEDSIKIPAFTNTLFLGDFCIIDNGVITKSNVSDQDTELWIEKIKNGLCDDVYMLVDGEYVPVGKVVYNIIGYDDLLIISANDDYTYSKFEDVYTKEGSVPLGRFVVDSCPRNHEDMEHRVVTAYSSKTPKFDGLSSEIAMLDRTNNTVKFDVQNLIASVLGVDAFSSVYESENVDPTVWTAGYELLRVYTRQTGQVYESYWIRSQNNNGMSRYTLSLDSNYVYKIRINSGEDYERFIAAIDVIENSYGSDYVVTKPIVDEDNIRCSAYDFYTGGVILTPFPNETIKLDVDTDYYFCVPVGTGFSFLSVFSSSASIARLVQLPNGGTDVVIDDYNIIDSVEVTRLYHTNASANVSIESSGSYSVNDVTYYTFKSGLDFAKLVNGWLELNALYGNQQRDGSYRLVTLNKDNPIEIDRSLIKSLWWNEYDIQPIGSIKYKFKSGSEENTTIYQFGDGKSVYDMTNNYVLQHLDGATAASVNLLLDSLFIPNIGGIAFTPVEMSMKGLPYIEDGDFLQIVVKDETEVMESFIEQSYQGYVAMFELPSTELSVYESKIQQVKVDGAIVTDYSVHAEQYAEDSFTLVITPTGYTSGTVTLLYGEEREIVETYVMNHTITGIQALSDSIESNGGEIIESEVI